LSDLQALVGEYVDELLGVSLGDAKAVKSVTLDADRLEIKLKLGLPTSGGYGERLANGLYAWLQAEQAEAVAGLTVNIDVASEIRSHAVQAGLVPIKGIKNIIAVASGKGGVGKSTTAVNLALALQAEGAKVGLLDADIYGPSQPRMMGISGRPELVDQKKIRPKEGHGGLKVMSIGFLIDEAEPMIWRGPMVTQALNQLLGETLWEDIDYLIVDLPPGTGDIQLTLSQKIPVAGSVIVTTPQDIALLDARKGLRMFEKVNVNVLGVVENMSTHICSNCGHEEHIFGEGGGLALATEQEAELLAALPLDINIRQEADSGCPTVVAQPDSPITEIYRDLALKVAARLSLTKVDHAAKFGAIKVTAVPPQSS
jgi:ATP-binding protein involved in chromosome partitioning